MAEGAPASKPPPSSAANTHDADAGQRRGLRVAVVGSGFAGLFAADRLAELASQGEALLDGPVHLFRGRSKLSSSQMETEHNTTFPRHGAAFFDYGCQYLTAGDEWFAGRMRRFEALGMCHRWQVVLLQLRPDGRPEPPVPLLAADGGPAGWAGVEGMWRFQEDVVQHVLAERHGGIEHHCSAPPYPPRAGQRIPDRGPAMVEQFAKDPDGRWRLTDVRGRAHGPFDVLVGAFDGHNHLHAQLTAPATRRMRDYIHGNLQHSPCIVAMVVFATPLGLPFPGAFVAGSDCLAWAANNNAKVGPGVPFAAQGREFWTFLAPPDYSCRSFEQDPKGYKQRAFRDVLREFGRLVGRDLQPHGPRLVRCLHWENGVPCNTIPAETGCLYDPEAELGWCGAFATYGGCEGAALSGRAVAEVIAKRSRGASDAQAAVEAAALPGGQWPDMGARVRDGYVRLGHGVFYLQHPLLRSIPPPKHTSGAAEAAAFWTPLKAWGWGGDGRGQGSDPNGRGTGPRAGRGEPKVEEMGGGDPRRDVGRRQPGGSGGREGARKGARSKPAAKGPPSGTRPPAWNVESPMLKVFKSGAPR